MTKKWVQKIRKVGGGGRTLFCYKNCYKTKKTKAP